MEAPRKSWWFPKFSRILILLTKTMMVIPRTRHNSYFVDPDNDGGSQPTNRRVWNQEDDQWLKSAEEDVHQLRVLYIHGGGSSKSEKICFLVSPLSLSMPSPSSLPSLLPSQSQSPSPSPSQSPSPSPTSGFIYSWRWFWKK